MSGSEQAELLGGGGGFLYTPTISANTNNYNMKSAAIAAGWDQVAPLVMTVTVNSGVVIGSTSTGSYAFDTGNTFPSGSRLKLVNAGKIVGKGGGGGDGSDAMYRAFVGDPGWGSNSSDGYSGTAGGPALNAQVALEIDNTGGVIGGGGGGGGGGAVSFSFTDDGCFDRLDSDGGGGGAGQGSTSSSGGRSTALMYQDSNECNTYTVAQYLAAGGASSDASAGAGGARGIWTGAANPCAASAIGGNGGALGSAGSAGESITSYVSVSCTNPEFHSGGGGGAAGACTQGNANITWTATGTRYGALN
ncbi:MAG TPA: hypothetical protein VFP29_12510 [Methyloceanibacter sp.]|nr:hypothetical protein [Methyloceanibacter sp.]